METEIQLTDDGSKTLYVPSLDEHYHSVKGAHTESMHIFINMGLKECKVEHPSILEIGFGTGLNALLTLQQSQLGISVGYTTLELYPLPLSTIEEMGYADNLTPEEASLYMKMHSAPWNQPVEITPQFNLVKLHADLTKLPLTQKYDVVYFDAFAPDKQPEMWDIEIFDHLYQHMNKGGIIVTYCSKGIIRRRLETCGFTVERLPGPPNGKREILRARKP